MKKSCKWPVDTVITWHFPLAASVQFRSSPHAIGCSLRSWRTLKGSRPLTWNKQKETVWLIHFDQAKPHVSTNQLPGGARDRRQPIKQIHQFKRQLLSLITSIINSNWNVTGFMDAIYFFHRFNCIDWRLEPHNVATI